MSEGAARKIGCHLLISAAKTCDFKTMHRQGRGGKGEERDNE
jgi:hypothetical protein